MRTFTKLRFTETMFIFLTVIRVKDWTDDMVSFNLLRFWVLPIVFKVDAQSEAQAEFCHLTQKC